MTTTRRATAAAFVLLLTLAQASAQVLAAHPAAARPPRYTWPSAPPHEVLRAFQPPTAPYGPGHRGVDLAAPPGTAIMAAADATVIFAGPVADRHVVSLSHEGGIRTTYEPVIPAVHPGQHIARGTRIGTLQPGHEGCPTACLHWGAHRTTPVRGREYLDPLGLLRTTRVRLLPATLARSP